jgi:RNA polymerase sigma-70 factor (ECF subfamily)
MAGFKGTCRFSTWLYRIALNECMETNTRQSRNTPLQIDSPELFGDPNARDGLAALSDAELRTAIHEAVRPLPLDQRTAFCLYYFEGYSGREAADAMKISEPNFFMKLKAARDKVKKSLLAQGWRL